MKRFHEIAVVLFLSISMAAFSQDLVLEYAEGVIQRNTKSGWQEVDIGDTISADSTIRISRNGFAEFSLKNLKISIKQDGTYLLSNLIGGSKQVDAWGVGSLVTGKIKTALAGSKRGETAAMGVRGAAATTTQPEVEWIEAGESSELLEKGKALLQRTQYSEAVGVFNEGLSVSHDEEGQLFLYYIGYTQYLQGHTALALKTLEQVNVDPQRSYYADLILLRGRLLIESLSFKEALGLFGTHISRYPEGDLTQALLLLSSFCYRGLGDLNEARSVLQRSYVLNPSTELGIEAKRLLQEL